MRYDVGTMIEHDGTPSGPLVPIVVPADAQVAPALAEELAALVDAAAQPPRDLDLTARLAWLIEVLIVRGHLTPAHGRMIAKIKGAASVVRLAVHPDHRPAPTPRDCAGLLPLCQGRCCAMDVSLSAEEVTAGKLRWELERPYLLPKDPDRGYCGDLGDDGRCTAYADRPATCRHYDCANDPRVWLDFARRLPAPMPWSLVFDLACPMSRAR